MSRPRREMSAGYMAAFSERDVAALRDIAEILQRHRERILDEWVSAQLAVYRPPRLTEEGLRSVFTRLFESMVSQLLAGRPRLFINDLYEIGAELAENEFPYESLIMSIHFFEESYMPFLVEDGPGSVLARFVSMDEFLHMALATLATSYFRNYRQRVQEEAAVGRVVQQAIAPSVPRRVLDLDVAHVYMSASERALVGGDIVDVFALDDGRAAFLVADVSGHGVAASREALMLHGLFRGLLRLSVGLEAVFADINGVLLSEMEGRRFVTAVGGIYDPASGGVSLVNAGHPRPLLCDEGCREAEGGEMLLGVFPDATFSAREFRWHRGQMLVAFTDGLVEARHDGVLLGEQRVLDVVSSMQPSSPEAVAEALRHEALRSSVGRLQDDVAILVMKRREADEKGDV